MTIVTAVWYILGSLCIANKSPVVNDALVGEKKISKKIVIYFSFNR